jgi:hypothetical protein
MQLPISVIKLKRVIRFSAPQIDLAEDSFVALKVKAKYLSPQPFPINKKALQNIHLQGIKYSSGLTSFSKSNITGFGLELLTTELECECESEEKTEVSLFALALTLTLFFVVPVGIEPTSSESESEILSIVLRNQEGCRLQVASYREIPIRLPFNWQHPAKITLFRNLKPKYLKSARPP